MAVSLRHAFTSAKVDSSDASLIQPSNWNEEHDITCSSGVVLGRLSASTGSVEEIGASSLASFVSPYLNTGNSIKSYGAVGDGTTDDRAAFVAAVAASGGNKLYCPAGTYRIVCVSSPVCTPPADFVLEGDGADVTEFVFEVPSTTFLAAMHLANGNFKAKGIKFRLVVPAGGTATVTNWLSSNISFEDCEFDGGVTDVAGSPSHTAIAVNCVASGTFGNLELTGCSVHDLVYPLLKSNVSTAVNDGIRFTRNDFYNNWSEDAGFNSPLGSMSNVIVESNTFTGGTGSSRLFIAFASIDGFRVSDNQCNGACVAAIHIEEKCRNFSVVGNTINVDGTGIRLLDNNVSGSVYFPQNGVIGNNTVNKSGTLKAAGSKGIYLVFDASAEVPAKQISVQGNVVSGFEHGIASGGTLDDAGMILDNVASDCSKGLYFYTFAANTRGNTTRSCDTGVYSEAGGVIEDHTFASCTANVGCTTHVLRIANPTFLFPEFTSSAGVNQFKDCIQLGVNDRAAGTAELTAKCDNTVDSGHHIVDVVWDGATFRRLIKLEASVGGVGLSIDRNSSYMSVNLFTVSARTNWCISARFRGIITVGTTFTTVATTNGGGFAAIDDTTSNTVLPVFDYIRRSTAAPASGIGASVRLITETASGNEEIGASIESVTTSVTSTAENFDLVFKNMTAGAAPSEILRLSGSNGANMKIPAGSSTQASANIASGTLKTTAAAGDIGFDGKTIYAAHAASAWGVVRMSQGAYLAADRSGSDTASAQAVFDAANDAFSVEATTAYRFEGFIMIARFAGTTSHTTAFLFGGTATVTSIAYGLTTTQSVGAPTETTAAKQRNIIAATAVNFGTTDTNATEYLTLKMEGIVRINGAGTFIPQFQYSAAPGGAPFILANSYFEMWPIGTGAMTKVGNVN